MIKKAFSKINLPLYLVGVVAFTLTLAFSIPAAGIALPFEETGVIEGAEFQIKVPLNWNGKLIVDHRPGSGPKGLQPIPAETLLLNAGFALAASGYSVSGGEGLLQKGPEDSNRLIEYFKSVVGVPDRIMLMGRATGATFVAKMIEKHPQKYDGGLAVDFGGAGFTRVFDRIMATWLAYDVAFGADSGFQKSDWGIPGDLRDDITIGEVLGFFGPQINEANEGKLEFMRLVYGGLEDWYVPSDGPFPSALILSFAFLEAGAKLEVEAGGAYRQNQDYVYTLQDDPNIADEKDYLASLGVDSDALLAELNAIAIKANNDARNYLSHHTDFSGKIRQPLLALMSAVNSIFPPENVTAYSQTVEANKKFGGNFVAAFVDQLGFGSQTATQYFKSVLALDNWIETGIAPDPDDDDIFPAAVGFIHRFDPGPWPF